MNFSPLKNRLKTRKKTVCTTSNFSNAVGVNRNIPVTHKNNPIHSIDKYAKTLPFFFVFKSVFFASLKNNFKFILNSRKIASSCFIFFRVKSRFFSLFLPPRRLSGHVRAFYFYCVSKHNTESGSNRKTSRIPKTPNSFDVKLRKSDSLDIRDGFRSTCRRKNRTGKPRLRIFSILAENYWAE